MTVTLQDLQPSALIRVALQDLALCEVDDTYKISMGRWHGPSFTSACGVCLAGAVIAQSLDADPSTTMHPLDYDDDIANSLYALNMFRVGYVKEALKYLHCPAVMLDRDIVDYRGNKERFLAQMDNLANDLEELGL